MIYLRMYNAQDKEGVTPAMVAVKKQNLVALKFLVSKNVDLGLLDHKKDNVYHYAATSSKDIIQVNAILK